MFDKSYAIHEGFITSKNDGDRHFITFQQLCRLYNLDPRTTVNWVKKGAKLKFENFEHLYPRYDGKYKNLGEIDV